MKNQPTICRKEFESLDGGLKLHAIAGGVSGFSEAFRPDLRTLDDDKGPTAAAFFKAAICVDLQWGKESFDPAKHDPMLNCLLTAGKGPGVGRVEDGL